MRAEGQIETIWLQDGTTLEVLVERVIDLGDGDLVTYSVPEWQADDGKRYFLQDYFYPRSEDYSGIIRTTGMPTWYQGMTIKDFDWSLYPEDTKFQQKLVDGFLRGFEAYYNRVKGLYIYSKTRGSGKTMLACLIGNELTARGIKVKFLSATKYIQMRINKIDTSEYVECPVLILDDIGAQSENQDYIRELIYDLLDARYENRRMIIFTSNMDIESCSKDDRIVSRVDRMGSPLRIPEISIRKMRSAEENKKLFDEAMHEINYSGR